MCRCIRLRKIIRMRFASRDQAYSSQLLFIQLPDLHHVRRVKFSPPTHGVKQKKRLLPKVNLSRPFLNVLSLNRDILFSLNTKSKTIDLAIVASASKHDFQLNVAVCIDLVKGLIQGTLLDVGPISKRRLLDEVT